MSKPSVLVNFLQALLAIILGNVVYFLLVPSLPVSRAAPPFSHGSGHGRRLLVLPGGLRPDPHAREWR